MLADKPSRSLSVVEVSSEGLDTPYGQGGDKRALIPEASEKKMEWLQLNQDPVGKNLKDVQPETSLNIM